MDLAEVPERSLTDFSKLPAQGKWHPAIITSAEAKSSSGGNSMIAVQTTLEGEAEGYGLFDNFLTDGKTKGGGFGKKKLMGCGVDTSQARPDEEVAAELLGKKVFVKVRHEIVKDEDPPGSKKYTKVRYDTNDKGEQVPVKKAVPLEYSLYDPTGAKAEPQAETKAPTASAAPAADAKPTPPWVKAKPAAAK